MDMISKEKKNAEAEIKTVLQKGMLCKIVSGNSPVFAASTWEVPAPNDVSLSLSSLSFCILYIYDLQC